MCSWDGSLSSTLAPRANWVSGEGGAATKPRSTKTNRRSDNSASKNRPNVPTPVLRLLLTFPITSNKTQHPFPKNKNSPPPTSPKFLLSSSCLLLLSSTLERGERLVIWGLEFVIQCNRFRSTSRQNPSSLFSYSSSSSSSSSYSSPSSNSSPQQSISSSP